MRLPASHSAQPEQRILLGSPPAKLLKNIARKVAFKFNRGKFQEVWTMDCLFIYLKWKMNTISLKLKNKSRIWKVSKSRTFSVKILHNREKKTNLTIWRKIFWKWNIHDVLVLWIKKSKCSRFTEIPMGVYEQFICEYKFDTSTLKMRGNLITKWLSFFWKAHCGKCLYFGRLSCHWIWQMW